ncbi:hypothetical protein K7X08_003633 [Anisodus acutangulus]|uniref:Uncharacterized protein n=1 Tax=Anisodus acutangulus TaxID=402998 RepID=A0A9Q1RJL1_9SOLA|nr:hypothetical protein K7X08_003633 [Anisodus acutangulus]
MGKRSVLLLLVLVLLSALVASVSGYEDEGSRREREEEESEQKTQGEKWFLLRHLHDVVKTDAGTMRLCSGEALYFRFQKDVYAGKFGSFSSPKNPLKIHIKLENEEFSRLRHDCIQDLVLLYVW